MKKFKDVVFIGKEPIIIGTIMMSVKWECLNDHPFDNFMFRKRVMGNRPFYEFIDCSASRDKETPLFIMKMGNSWPNTVCDKCGKEFHAHGVLKFKYRHDNFKGPHVVCPGDYIVHHLSDTGTADVKCYIFSNEFFKNNFKEFTMSSCSLSDFNRKDGYLCRSASCIDCNKFRESTSHCKSDSYKKVSIISIAEQCHQANKTFCEQIGDFSQKDWKDAPEWQRTSAINGVKFHQSSKLTAKPEDSHNSWMKEKVESGWVYGEVKDEEKKTHPCIVPYEQLPLKQRLKDHIFIGICHTMIPFLDHSLE